MFLFKDALNTFHLRLYGVGVQYLFLVFIACLVIPPYIDDALFCLLICFYFVFVLLL